MHHPAHIRAITTARRAGESGVTESRHPDSRNWNDAAETRACGARIGSALPVGACDG